MVDEYEVSIGHIAKMDEFLMDLFESGMPKEEIVGQIEKFFVANYERRKNLIRQYKKILDQKKRERKKAFDMPVSPYLQEF